MEQGNDAQVVAAQDAPKKSFKDALASPAGPAPSADEAADGKSPASPTGAPASDEVAKKKRPHLAKNGGVNSGNHAALKRETAELLKTHAQHVKSTGNADTTKSASSKKGGRQLNRGGGEVTEAPAKGGAAGKEAATKAKAAKRKTKGADSNGNGADAEEEREVVPYAYKHPKPRVLTEAVFLWELVAAFSEPKTVLLLERLCQDVAAKLQASRQANHLMQRYWNAQWARMVWEESKLTAEKRYLLPSALSRSEGKINWKKMFKEEYPLWLQRTFAGVGSNNNANNVAKVLFQQEILNENKSAAELAKSELTLEEAFLKAQRKRGVEVEVDNEDDDDDKNSVEGAKGGKRGPGSPSGGHDAGKGFRVRVPVHDPQAGFTRSDYKQNYRQGARKGKHMKGGDKKWESYAAMDDGDDW